MLQPDEIYILGRRQPQNSKLVVWNSARTTGLEEYNSLADTIPSRIHGPIARLGDGKTLYSDLGSSAGSILVGQSPDLGAFVRIYDPGFEISPMIKTEKIFPSKSTRLG